MLFANYPYTDLHELNLDWILKKIKELDKEVDDFVAYNKLTWAGTWDGSAYPKWSIVDDGNGNGYMSIQPVPPNVPLTNTDYWQPVAQYSAIYNAFNARITDLETRVQDLEDEIGNRPFVTPEDFGAVGDGTTDDRTAIQAAIDSGLPVMFYSDKIYAVGLSGTARALTLHDDSELIMNGAEIKLIPEQASQYSILFMEGVKNVVIKNGTITGDKAYNPSATEFCYGIFGSGVENVLIDNVTVKSCAGDGIEFGGNLCKEVTVRSCVCDGNGRNGLSITNADGAYISGSAFLNASGHNPQEGVDLEANTASDVLKNIYISDCKMTGNVHAGLNVLSLADGDSVFVSGCKMDCSAMVTVRGTGTDVKVTDCSIKPYKYVDYGADWSYGVGFGISVGCASGSSVDVSRISLDCTNYPTCAILYGEGVTIPERYNIKCRGISVVRGRLDRWILNRGGAVHNCEIEIFNYGVVPESSSGNFITRMNGDTMYKVAIIGRYEFQQAGGDTLSAYGDEIVATASTGLNTTVMYLQPGTPIRIYNEGSNAFGIVGGTFTDLTGQTSNRVEIPANQGIEILYSIVNDTFSYRFI